VLARSAAEPGRSKRALAYSLLALAVIAVIVVAAVAVKNLASKSSTGAVKVPNVIGLQKDAAIAKLEATGLAPGMVTPSYFPSDAPAVGQVVSQSIDDGFPANAGAKIDLVYSGGLEQTQVPAVVGQSLADATKNLQAANLKVGSMVLMKESDTQTPGTVLSVAPDVGKMVAYNTTVTLTVVSNGSTVPVIDGLTLDAAEQAIAAAGFTTGAVHSEVNTSVAPGTVLTSKPGQGRSGVLRGSSIDITVATTPPPTTAPPTTAPPTSAAPTTAATTAPTAATSPTPAAPSAPTTTVSPTP
jgi:serine/threonine-protein kinase